MIMLIFNRLSKFTIACFVGMLLVVPSSFAVNYDAKIFEFQQKLAKGGDPQAQYKLATMYETGRGVETNIEKAIQWYQVSAKNNHLFARHRLTYIDVKSTGYNPRVHGAWFTELKQESRLGNGDAIYILGELYEGGIGVKKSLKQAQKHYKSATSIGNIDAETRLYEVTKKLNAIAYQQQEKNLKNTPRAQPEPQAKNNPILIAKEKQKAKELAEQNRKRIQARKVQEWKLKQKAIAERKKFAAERRNLAAEKRKLEVQKKALAKKQALAEAAIKQTAEEDAAKKKKAEKPEGFESELCSGRAARFRTQCK